MANTAAPAENPKKALAQSDSSVPNSTSVTSQPQPAAGGGETKVAATVVNSDTDGPVTDIQKKIRRAERFGTPVKLSEGEKRNSRAERFGTGAGLQGSDALKKSEEQKKKVRAERFGLAQPAQETPEDNEAKKKARLARFAPSAKIEPAEEDKRKARAARFSQTQPTLSQANNSNAKVEKTAVDHVQAPE